MFYVGQKVVCVDAKKHPHYTPWRCRSDLHGLTEGVVYTVRAIGEYRGLVCVWLCEIIRPVLEIERNFGECGYALQRFRPAVERKTDISVFKKMLIPAEKETV